MNFYNFNQLRCQADGTQDTSTTPMPQRSSAEQNRIEIMDIGKFLQQQYEKSGDQKSDYEKMISAWIGKVEKSSLNKKEKKKRCLELCHLASFAISLKDRGIIEDVQEIDLADLAVEPDFIISYKGQKLGLEVRRVLNEKAQEIGEKRSFLNSVERSFAKKYPGIKVFSSISFNKSFDVKTVKKDLTRNQTADFIYSQITGKGNEMPPFIKGARCVEHTHLTFNLSGGYWVGILDEEIKQGIIEKEKKLKNYRAKTNLEKVWLLLVVSGASPESDFSYFDETAFVCNNSFDSVFLLNDFKKNVYCLKKDWNNSVSN